MKLKFISMAVFSALTLGVATNASAVTTVNGGTVHFKGEVVDAACAVNMNSTNQTVQLGQVRTAALDTDGKTSGPVGFSIQLDECDLAVSTGAKIIFSGTPVTGKTNVLAVQGSASGTAKNVGIQILDPAGNVMDLNADSSTAYNLSTGTNIIPFSAQYIAVGGKATAGAANADATFKVQYQ
ncbi:TPA: type 1 fimbrial major subunit FimA [Escherichia coli]|uniref:type 1 fimbrial major subunit FimA n=1 Tax=Escherichia coli TaxID=562 RepID=UPI001877A7B6|nr:type 1 fimbrial major subunit FimA [Escherichia coli]EIM8542731.1 type 1 fimbrial major subunit FimA [Escherichia coli]EME4703258.1 type 1 fimbrial major subunit FimA [Escherichia coli]MBW9792395.1 type 1 fimbrial protein subunit FimA [Escherichia coli]MCO0461388.1 type 1 fimbrial major subunit FimA [Escherichia coli]HDW7348365.1 type 1 fimbrial major subunit FimA [Escherichia coli]